MFERSGYQITSLTMSSVLSTLPDTEHIDGTALLSAESPPSIAVDPIMIAQDCLMSQLYGRPSLASSEEFHADLDTSTFAPDLTLSGPIAMDTSFDLGALHIPLKATSSLPDNSKKNHNRYIFKDEGPI